MANKRKYPEVKGYWVYSIQIPSINKYYIGVSKRQCCQRWRKCNYKGMALEPYLDEWDSMVKTVLVNGLNKEDAYIYEDNIIRALSINDLCINQQRSGLIFVSDENAYHKQYREDNKENHKQLCKQWQENNPEYQKQWRENNPEYHKQYYENNKEKIREYNKERYERNKESIKEKQWQKDNKEKKREYDKQRYERKKLEKQQQTSVH